jgi:hypothetical protein
MRFKFGPVALLSSVKRMRTARFEIATLIILCVGVVLAFAWNDGKLADFWTAIQPHNQQYTALAFTDANTLPIALDNNNTLSFAFTVGNVEGKTTSYPYIVTVTSKTGNKVVSVGNVTIPADGEVIVPEKLTLVRTSDPEAVTVTLPIESESIDFMLKGSAA